MKKRNKQRRRRRKNSIMKKLFLLAFASAIVYFYWEWDQAQALPEDDPPTIEVEMPEVQGELEMNEGIHETDFPSFQREDTAALVDLANLHSTNAILVDFSSGRTIAEEKSQEKVYPASLTKMMTILLGIERMNDLDKEIKMEERYFEGLYEMDASMAGFQIDEVVTYRDILYGAMLPSGAESCLAIASLISGSEDAFVELMNQKAKEIGMTETHFANTTGLHDPENYSTVKDMEVLLEHALQNKDFAQIFTTREHQTAPTNMSPEGVRLESAVFRYMELFPELEPLIKGGKTGYTEEAGLCLASLAEVDGKKYILVTAGAPSEEEMWEPLHIEDAALVYLQLKH